MSYDLTAHDAALKQHYTNDRIENMVYQDNALLALMPKMKNFGGRNLPIPTIHGNPQNRSATFAQAQAGTSTSKLDDFLLTRVKDYSLAFIDNETIEASKGDANAFLEAMTVEIDGAIHSLTRSLAIAQYGDGWGAIGQLSVNPGADILQLKNIEDIANFEQGQVLVAAAAAGSGNLRGSDPGDSATILGLDRDLGQIKLSGSAPASWDADDYLFVKGDRQYTATTPLKLAGLEAWNPYATPGAGLFFSVDRTKDVTRLSGCRMDGTNMPIEEVLIKGAARVGREGFALTHYFMNWDKYAQLELALGSKVQYVDLKVTAEIGFRGIQVSSGRGPIRVLADQNCPSNRIRGLNMNFWKHYSLGETVKTLDTDGLQMLRQVSADGVEARMGYYANMGNRAPASNIAIEV